MAEKKVSAISGITLNTATFTDESFAPTYINFFYGKNGAGKTSLGRQLGEGAGLTWADGESPANYEIHLYNQDFIVHSVFLVVNNYQIVTIKAAKGQAKRLTAPRLSQESNFHTAGLRQFGLRRMLFYFSHRKHTFPTSPHHRSALHMVSRSPIPATPLPYLHQSDP